MKPNMTHNSVFSTLSDKDKVDFYISLAVVLLAGMFILYYSFPSQFQSDDAYNSNILLDNSLEINEVQINEGIYLPVTENELKRSEITPVEKIKTIALPHYIASSSVSDTTNRNRLENAKQEIPNSTQTEVKEELVNLDTVSATKIDTLSTPNEIIDVSIEKLSTTSSQFNIDKQSSKESNTSCIIVIGAYSKQKGIDKLTKKLEKDQYNIFRTPYKGLTRIGVYLPCDKSQIEKELVKIRKKYAADAMVLRKN